MFTSALGLVEDALDNDDILNVVMSGQTSVGNRLRFMEKFKETKDLNVMLVHYKVGGEGLNLTEATHVILLEPWWTHAVHNQGIFRAWRRGQDKEVYAHWVLMKKSIELPILRLCENKQEIADFYLNNGMEPDNYKTIGLDIHSMKALLASSE